MREPVYSLTLVLSFWLIVLSCCFLTGCADLNRATQATEGDSYLAMYGKARELAKKGELVSASIEYQHAVSYLWAGVAFGDANAQKHIQPMGFTPEFSEEFLIAEIGNPKNIEQAARLASLSPLVSPVLKDKVISEVARMLGKDNENDGEMLLHYYMKNRAKLVWNAEKGTFQIDKETSSQSSTQPR